MEKHKVVFGDQTIEFDIERKNVKNVNLNVRPNMQVVVSANNSVPIDFIHEFIKQKAPWILKIQSYFKDVQPEYHSKLEYVDGESIKYLGKQYRLKVQVSEHEQVKYQGGYIYIYVRNKDDIGRKERLFNSWLRDRASVVFNEVLDKMYLIIHKYDIKRPKLIYKIMKARWGSCIKDSNTILLNFELIKAPKFCIEYVVLHELIHFKFSNHDKEFINFLSTLMPDWKLRKEILDEEVVRGL